MADRSDLERALAGLRSHLDYPPTPALGLAVTRHLEADRERRARPVLPGLALWPRRRVVALLALGFLLLAGAAAAARLVIGAIEVRVVPTLSAPSAVERGPALGEPVTLEEARAAVSFEVLAPAGLPAPDRVFLDRSSLGERVTLGWQTLKLPVIEGTPWGLLLMELASDEPFAVKEIAVKELDATGTIQGARVSGTQGLWITGSHNLTLRTEGGELPFRVTGNVLLWQEGDVTLRLESALPKREAIRIAESIG